MRLVKEFIGKEVLSADVEILGKVSEVIPFDTVDKIGDKVVLKSAFAEDDGLSNIEKEIQDLKNQL